jgi:hypothetical protein
MNWERLSTASKLAALVRPRLLPDNEAKVDACRMLEPREPVRIPGASLRDANGLEPKQRARCISARSRRGRADDRGHGEIHKASSPLSPPPMWAPFRGARGLPTSRTRGR